MTRRLRWMTVALSAAAAAAAVAWCVLAPDRQAVDLPTGSDELGRLGASFKRMTEGMGEAYSSNTFSIIVDPIPSHCLCVNQEYIP